MGSARGRRIASDPAPRPGRRRYRLSGATAIAWFGDRGVRASPLRNDDTTLQVIADELVAGTFVARRIWHTAVALRCSAVDLSDPGDTLMLQVDGEAVLVSDTSSRPVTSHDVVLRPLSPGTTMTCAAPSARIDVRLSMPLPHPPGSPLLLPAPTTTPASSALASLLNSILNADGEPSPRVLSALGTAVEATADALLLERVPSFPDPGASDRLFDEALSYVRTWGHSASVTVQSVVDALHVSRQYLTQVFTDRGTTIGGELRRHRAALAVRMLETGLMDASEVAAASGFPSVRAMRQTLRGSGVSGLSSTRSAPSASVTSPPRHPLHQGGDP